jgi:hypothetical protein
VIRILITVPMTPRDVVANAFFPCLSSEEEYSRFREKGVQKNPHSFHLCLSLWREEEEEEEEEEETSAPFFQNQLLSLSLSLFLFFSPTLTLTTTRALQKKGRET